MKETKLTRLSGKYLAALRSHVEHGPQAGLQAAHELGCLAVAIGLETLDLARVHEQVMATLVIPDCAATMQDEITRRAAAFFTEAVTPIEKTHRTALAASADLNQVNATLARRTMDLEDSNRELQRGIALRKVAADSLEASQNQSATLLEEAGHLQKHLQDMARQILSTQEDERKTMSLKLQDEIAQTLLGIQMRLLALDKEISVSTEDFRKEIANTQRLVESSVKTINRFARELGIKHEE